MNREPAALDRLLSTALVGAVLGAALSGAGICLLVPAFVRVIDPSFLPDVPVQVAVGILYGIAAAVVVATAIIAVRLRLRDLARIRRTSLAMAVLLPIAGILITPLTMGFAWITGYSDAPPVVLVETALVLAALAGATVLARRWALREPATAEKVPA